MKRVLLSLLSLYFFVGTSYSQEKLLSGPLFGTDVILNNLPTQNQENITVCSAFNGWIYGAYTYYKNTDELYTVFVLSTDNGKTWSEKKVTGPDPGRFQCKRLELTTTGNQIDSIKLYLTLNMYDPMLDVYNGIINRFNGITFEKEAEILHDYTGKIMDISTCNNLPYSSNQLATIYSKTGTPNDSLIFLASTNGGYSFNIRKPVAIAPSNQKIFKKVNLVYGHSASLNNGYYFATWEYMDMLQDAYGNIYSCNINPSDDFSFSPKVCLDSLDITHLKRYRSPKTSSSNANYDNVESGITTTITAECETGKTTCFYNTDILSYHNFSMADIGIKKQCDIGFCEADSTFKITYYDDVNHKLPVIRQSIDFSNPSQWDTETTGYNDSPELSAPNPKIRYNPATSSCMYVWRNGDANTGQGLFDAPYIYYSGVKTGLETPSISIYPNPCNTSVNIVFDRPENYEIQFFDQSGKKVFSGQSRQKQLYTLDLTSFSRGIYVLKIIMDNDLVIKKVIKE